jgi:hypothetical protein
VQTNGGMGSIAFYTTQPVPGTVLTNSLKVTVTQGQRVGAATTVFDIPVKPLPPTARPSGPRLPLASGAKPNAAPVASWTAS